MSAKHSLYKSKDRWDKATDAQRTYSAMQRRINHLQKVNRHQAVLIRARKLQSLLWGKLIHQLTEDNKMTKDYAYPYLLRKKEAEAIVKEFSSEVPMTKVAFDLLDKRLGKADG